MRQSWNDIADYFGKLQTSFQGHALEAALGGIEQLAASIAEGPLNRSLFAWSSMYSLCIQQTDTEPLSGPYLCISPLPSGLVEFRYIDTPIAERQWHRTVEHTDTIARFERFLDQLHWVARPL